jgi:hypothetical protein
MKYKTSQTIWTNKMTIKTVAFALSIKKRFAFIDVVMFAVVCSVEIE